MKKRSQATLELTLAMLGVILLLYGVLSVFMWANKSLISREADYETDASYGRVAAGSVSTEVEVDESNYQMDIFGRGQ